MIKIKEKSDQILTFWSCPFGWAPDSAANKLSEARLDWMNDLTNCLDIWQEKSIFLNNGELLLAWANLGALVEGWLKLFYCVYYEDYLINPKLRNGDILEPNDMRFEGLKQFSRGILWDKNSEWDIWVELVQHRRNAIHAFNHKEIGTPFDLIASIDKFNDFIDVINNRLPYP